MIYPIYPLERPVLMIGVSGIQKLDAFLKCWGLKLHHF
jgi:hypothetical protein